MPPQSKALAAKPEGLRLILETHVVEGEKYHTQAMARVCYHHYSEKARWEVMKILKVDL